MRVVPQARPSYELQRRSSLSTKVEDHDWISLASQGRAGLSPTSRANAPSAYGLGNAVFSQSSIRGGPGGDSVLQSPAEEFPVTGSSSYLGTYLPPLSAAGQAASSSTAFKPFNPWSPSQTQSNLPAPNSEDMTDLLAPFGLTYVDPLEDNFTAANASGGLRDNLFGIMTNNFNLPSV